MLSEIFIYIYIHIYIQTCININIYVYTYRRWVLNMRQAARVLRRRRWQSQQNCFCPARRFCCPRISMWMTFRSSWVALIVPTNLRLLLRLEVSLSLSLSLSFSPFYIYVCNTARKASWNKVGVEPGNQEGPGC